jgi:acetyl-CoA carboxylase carboxyl transferase subunit alpha
MADIYSKLTPWQKTQVARHPHRPHFLDYAKELIEDFTPLAGDRKFAEDEAIHGRPRPLPRALRRRDRPGKGLRHGNRA